MHFSEQSQNTVQNAVTSKHLTQNYSNDAYSFALCLQIQR